jgi:branched-chain amino acid transport system ATP-binding protein
VSDPVAVLTAQGLNAGYGRSQVLFDMQITVPRQGAVAVLGRNGAGKSTLLKILAGELRPMAGSITFDGVEASHEPSERRARRGLGYVPQEDAIFGKLTVHENLLLGATHQSGGRNLDEVFDIFPKLADRLRQTAATLSGGERKMLAIGRALLGNPKLLILDEPTEGVWIGVIEEIAACLSVLSRSIGVILVEQHVDLALCIAGYAYVMNRGSVVVEGTSEQVRADRRLLRYLAP